MRPLSIALVAAVAVSLSCAALDGILRTGSLQPPEVSFREAVLVSAPSQRDLAAYYCPRVAQTHLGLGGASSFLCSQMFGRAPAANAMQVGFDLRFAVKNPNQVPLPVSEILTVVTAFPQASNQSLGALCLRLCAPDDPGCSGGTDPNACRDASGDIRRLSDFPNAIANLLIAESVGGETGRFVGPQIIAGAAVDVVTRFSFLPEALLPAMEQLARQSVDELRAGREVTFAIPYKLEGTFFINAGALGRIAAGYGPATGTWVLPRDRLFEAAVP